LKKHEAIRQVAADVWYVHSPELCAVLPSGDAKIAFHLHGASTTAGYSSHKWLRNPIGSFAFRSIVETSIKKSDLVLGVNEDCRRLASAHGVSYVSAPPFVDARVFYAADGLHRPTGNFTIGYVGRIDDNKNVGFLVEVLACLLRRGLDARLLVGGDGPSAADLARQIQELGLSNHVTMLGWLPHESVPEVLRSIDFFVMASVVEGLPTALLEAMACGCVPVVPATNEFLQVVSPGENGLVYEGYNAEVVAKSVIDALPIRETLAENALSLIRREYTDAVVLPRVLESLKALTEL
jgi:glycosyltransferase involved in cell wall biosynthesis